jgi:hypothetical protein
VTESQGDRDDDQSVSDKDKINDPLTRTEEADQVPRAPFGKDPSE